MRVRDDYSRPVVIVIDLYLSWITMNRISDGTSGLSCKTFSIMSSTAALHEPIWWEGSRLLTGIAVCGCCGRHLRATSGYDWRYDCDVVSQPRPAEEFSILGGAEIDSKVVSAFLRTVAAGWLRGFSTRRREVSQPCKTGT